MMIEYFDLPHEEETTVSMPYPMVPMAWRWNHQNGTVRMYYSQMPEAQSTEITFYMVPSEHNLMATFPGKYAGTVQTEDLDEREDSAIHIFIQTPVNKPDKPHIIPNKSKKKKSKKKRGRKK